MGDEKDASAKGGDGGDSPVGTSLRGVYVLSGAFVVVILVMIFFLVPHLSRANAMAVQLEDLRAEVRDLRGSVMKLAMRKG